MGLTNLFDTPHSPSATFLNSFILISVHQLLPQAHPHLRLPSSLTPPSQSHIPIHSVDVSNLEQTRRQKTHYRISPTTSFTRHLNPQEQPPGRPQASEVSLEGRERCPVRSMIESPTSERRPGRQLILQKPLGRSKEAREAVAPLTREMSTVSQLRGSTTFLQKRHWYPYVSFTAPPIPRPGMPRWTPR